MYDGTGPAPSVVAYDGTFTFDHECLILVTCRVQATFPTAPAAGEWVLDAYPNSVWNGGWQLALQVVEAWGDGRGNGTDTVLSMELNSLIPFHAPVAGETYGFGGVGGGLGPLYIANYSDMDAQVCEIEIDISAFG